MDEYIERKAAKKAMCRMCEGGSKLVCGTLNDLCTTMRVFDAIPAADVRPVVPKWIPVAERLPETSGEYIVAYHPCYWDRVHDEIKVGLDSFRGKTSWAKKKYQRVTHWMTLPQPPKEG